jgi:hypothetical protein
MVRSRDGRSSCRVRFVWTLLFCAASSPVLQAQTIDDGLAAPRQSLVVGVGVGRDRWSSYWEGTLKRENENVGTLTTKSVSWMLNYGLTSRLNLIASLPYISTEASGGTLHPQDGFQDLTVAAKACVLDTRLGAGDDSIRTFAVASYGTPVTDYVADLLPLSIGLQNRRGSGRLTTTYHTGRGWFAEATGAYTVRGNVTLDRPSYYTDDQLFLSDKVDMPDVIDYTVRLGYMSPRWMVPVSYSRQNTLGGGDIRRQDAPFVSNRMNFSKVEAMAMYTLPTPANLAIHVHATRVLTGRNVGESTTLGAGLLYTLRFSRE